MSDHPVPLSLVGVRVELPSNAPIVLLKEEGGDLYLPIFIGAVEATAIVFALQGVATPRPLTHDLLKGVLDSLDVSVERVTITKLEGGTFYSTIVLNQNGQLREVSSRPSDAIALAVRASVPIYATRKVLDDAGIPIGEDELSGDGDSENAIEEFREFLESVNPEDFQG